MLGWYKCWRQDNDDDVQGMLYAVQKIFGSKHGLTRPNS
jgi:hypothetical protein